MPYRLAALAEQILASRHHRILAQTLIETQNAETAGKSHVAMIPRPVAHPFDQILRIGALFFFMARALGLPSEDR